jgi:hypothetical protein
MRRTADQMPLNIECVADRRMNRNEALSGFGRFEALHLSFSSSNRLMRVFRTVVGTQSLRRRPVYIEARGHSKSRDICSVSLGLAVAWREYPVMSLQAAPVEEDRWSPVEVLIWIATRSRRFMDALKGLPLSSVEDRLWRLQRESHSPHPLSLSGALLALREEAKRGHIPGLDKTFPRESNGTIGMLKVHDFARLDISFWAADVLRTWPGWPPALAWDAAKTRPWQAGVGQKPSG